MKTKKLKFILIFLFLVISVEGNSQGKKKDIILKDAVAIWNMSDVNSISGRGNLLKTEGNIRLGIKLDPVGITETSKYLRDGNVAEFDGGYLIAGGEKLQLTGNNMTFCIRFLNKSDEWNVPIIARSDPADKYGSILFQEDGMLKYTWRTNPASGRVTPEWFMKQKNLPTDFLDGILRIGVPTDMIGAGQWHEVIVRYSETVVEMFVDGVLVDEEWTQGSLFKFNGPFLIGADYKNGKINPGFNGFIDHVALWDRSLTDSEITEISGGSELVARRELEILGPGQKSLQYWHPRGFNTSAGDVMCLFEKGTFHVFWLYDRRHHGSKWIMGAHQYAHVSTTDLINWKHHPIAVPISRSWESAMGTGDFIVKDGIFNAFYTDCGSRVEFPEKPHKGSGIFRATSIDGINYVKDEVPVVEGGDCSIFHDDATSRFYLVKNGMTERGESGLTYYTSSDLNSWTLHKDLLLEDGGACPHLFKWNSWYYLSVGARFWRSENVTGPWIPNVPHRISYLEYPKTAEYNRGRRLAGGWIGDKGWGGDLAFFELVQNPNGSLGTRFIQEMIPASGDPLNLNFSKGYTWLADHPRVSSKDSLRLVFGTPDKTYGIKSVKVEANNGFRAVMTDKIPLDVRITMTVKPEPNTVSFGICLRAAGNFDSGCELQFNIPDKRIQFAKPDNGVPAQNLKENAALNGIEGLDKPFTLDVIVRGTIIDACIDSRQTLIERNYDCIGDRLFFYAKDGNVSFEDITVRPLTDEK